MPQIFCPEIAQRTGSEDGVAQNGILPYLGLAIRWPQAVRQSADHQSAIQQAANLRNWCDENLAWRRL